MPIRSFNSKITKEIFDGVSTRQTEKLLPTELHEKARVKMARVAAASTLNDLISLRGNRFEKLRGDMAGQFSIRINDQYRICFRWENNDAYDVEIVDYH
ncbi:MAG: type II toxin-antitoxin system RelE/ParE family toxin [Pyrinomonadaceae bacterium]